MVKGISNNGRINTRRKSEVELWLNDVFLDLYLGLESSRLPDG